MFVYKRKFIHEENGGYLKDLDDDDDLKDLSSGRFYSFCTPPTYCSS